MKVYVGPYISWIGPYQIANILQKIGVSEDRCYKIGGWLDETWVSTFCSWLYKKRQRKIKIKLHDYDSWNVDITLSYIIRPLLQQLKENKNSYSHVDKEDVPEALWGTYDEQGFSGEAYDDVLDEIIWATDPEWEDKYDFGGLDSERMANHKRRANAMTLFGKYYFSFWD